MRVRLWRTLLTLAGISLGVAVVLAIEITNKSTLQSIENMFGQAVGKAELVVIPNADQNDFDGRVIDRIRRASGVFAAVPALKVRTLIENEDTGSEAHWGVRGVELGRSFEVRGFDVTLDPLLQVYNLVEGGFPSGSKFEIMVTQKFAEDKSYELGNYLPIVTPTGTVKVKIVGLLSEEGAGLVNDGQVGFVPYDVVQQVFDIGHNVNEILIQVEPGIGSNPKMLEELKTNLQNRIGPDAQVVHSSARGNILPEMLNTYQIGLSTFSIIAIVVGAFLIYNTFTMTVVERTREIGMLRAIGMSRKQVLELILAEAFILSAMGSVLGVFSGFYLAQGLVILQSGFIQVKDINLALTTEDVLKSIGIGLAITYISALIPALQASRISPIEALRAKSRSIEKVNPTIWILGVILAFIGWLFLYQIPWREDVLMIMGNIGFFSILVGFVLTVPIAVGIFGKVAQSISTFFYRIEGKLGAENIKRSVSRTMLTVASLMIALIMIIGINSLAYSLKVDIQTWTNSAMAGDLFISATESFRQSFTQTLTEVPGIKSISPATYLSVKFNSNGFPKQESLPKSLTFTAIDPVLYRQVGDMVFSSGQGQKEEIWREFSSGDKLFISTVVSEKTGLEQGDYLTLVTKRGEHAFKIAAVNTDFASQGLTITGTYSDLKHWFSDTNINRFTVSASSGV